jgi:predicted dehydrogenase
MKRRDFVKLSGLVAGSILSPVGLVQAASTRQNKLTLGIIGCGSRGNGMIRLLNELTGSFTVSSICDVLDFRLKEAQGFAPAAKPFKDYRSLLEDKKVDAVIIATPLHLHYPIAVAALEAGKHVYLEKTMTYSIEEAVKLVAKAKQYPTQVLQIGHQYRYTPLYHKVKEYIQKGYLGKVTQLDCRWDRNANWRKEVPDPSLERQINWRMYREYSGGLVAELLSHQIDFVHWAFNTRPDEISATGGIDYFKDGRETYDNVQVTMRYQKEGMVGNFGATCANEYDGYLFKIKGTKGTVKLLMNEGFFYPEKVHKQKLETVDGVTGATKLTWDKQGGVPILPGSSADKDGTHYALVDFFKCIDEKLVPGSDVSTGARTAITVHLANEALYSKTDQVWKQEYDKL